MKYVHPEICAKEHLEKWVWFSIALTPEGRNTKLKRKQRPPEQPPEWVVRDRYSDLLGKKCHPSTLRYLPQARVLRAQVQSPGHLGKVIYFNCGWSVGASTFFVGSLSLAYTSVNCPFVKIFSKFQPSLPSVSCQNSSNIITLTEILI